MDITYSNKKNEKRELLQSDIFFIITSSTKDKFIVL